MLLLSIFLILTMIIWTHMKIRPVGAILQSSQSQKQTFVFTNPPTEVGSVRLNTSFDIGTVTARGVKLSQTRYHLTSVLVTDPIDSPQGDTFHLEVVVRHHPRISKERVLLMLDILNPLLEKSVFADELLTPGLYTGQN